MRQFATVVEYPENKGKQTTLNVLYAPKSSFSIDKQKIGLGTEVKTKAPTYKCPT